MIQEVATYIYQNSVTGEISTTPLTLTQLCRILCPSNPQTPPLRHLNASTNVLQLQPDGTYSTDGWKPIHQMPVLREAVTMWYYYSTTTVDATSINSTTGMNTTTTTTTTAPVTCRQLAKITEDDNNLQVCSTLTDSKWKTLIELPYLQTALEILREQLLHQQQATTTANSATSSSTTTKKMDDSINDKGVQEELEAFLKATEQQKVNQQNDCDNRENDNSDDDQAYESDGGTQYSKDRRTGDWVQQTSKEHLKRKRKVPTTTIATNENQNNSTAATSDTPTGPLSFRNDDSNNKSDSNENQTKRKGKKAKFSSKKARCWVYVTNLPTNCTVDEVASVFSKAGILDLDEHQRPKIKLYRDPNNHQLIKGDASVCYARPESVQLALTLLDETPLRMGDNMRIMTVQAARFEQHGDSFDTGRQKISQTKRLVVKLATRQALDWDEGEFNGRLTGGHKGLRIIVVQNLFTPQSLQQDDDGDDEEHLFFEMLERQLRSKCEQWGTVEKITVFSQNPKGVAVIKFALPGAASEAVKGLDRTVWQNNNEKMTRNIEASFWDGVTDFTIRDEVKEAHDDIQRQEEFGDWLESQEVLPEELQLKTEESD